MSVRHREEEGNAHPPWVAASVVEAQVLWRKPGAGCSSEKACTANIFGFNVQWGDITGVWEKAGKGWELIEERLGEWFGKTKRENETVCKAVSYGLAGGGYFLPEGRLAKMLGVLVGFSTTFAC
jgi:hypothetical protein